MQLLGEPRLRSRLLLILAACAGALVLLSMQQLVLPVRNGPLALGQVFAPYLSLSLLLAVPFALAPVGTASERRARTYLRLTLAICAVLAIARFGTIWVSLPASPAPDATRIGVTSWNLELGEGDPDVVVQALRAAEPGVIGLEELTPRHAAAIIADPVIRAHFPYALMFPRDGSLGLGILSSTPFKGPSSDGIDPPLLWAVVDAGGGRTITVVVAHPLPAAIATVTPLDIPVGYDATDRDAHLLALRAAIDPLLAGGRPFVMLGDFNVTDREPAYLDLRDGGPGAVRLIDAHAEVGLGPGSTWRPPEVQWLPFGLLRIDMVFTANGVRSISISTDCTPRSSDHCIVEATVTVP